MKIEEKRQRFLQKLYELTESNENDIRDMWEIGRTLGFPNNLTNRIGQYLEGEGLIVFRTEQGEISITHEGVKEMEKAISEKNKIELKKKAEEKGKVDPKKVFVVHGRNEKARIAMFSFLRSIDLKPLEWEEAVRLTGEASPFPQQVLDAAFMIAQAIIILITGDDMGKLRDEYIKPKDKEHERNLTIQARQNVIFEAGLAFGKNPKRTILVELEKEDTRPFSDIYGRLTVRLSNDAKSKKKLIDRLTTAGCHTNIDARNDWISTGNFDSAVIEYKPTKKGIKERESKNTELFEKVIRESENGYFWFIDAIANEEEDVIEGLFLDRYKAKFKKRIADFKGMVSFFEVNGIIQRIWRHTYIELSLTPKGYSLLKYWNKKLKDRK